MAVFSHFVVIARSMSDEAIHKVFRIFVSSFLASEIKEVSVFPKIGMAKFIKKMPAKRVVLRTGLLRTDSVRGSQ